MFLYALFVGRAAQVVAWFDDRLRASVHLVTRFQMARFLLLFLTLVNWIACAYQLLACQVKLSPGKQQ